MPLFHLKLKTSLLLLSIFPILAILLVFIFQLRLSLQDLDIYREQTNNIQFIKINSNVIHQLQIERGLSATLINGEKVQKDLSKIRNDLESLWQPLIESYNNSSFYLEDNKVIQETKQAILQYRAKIDNLEVDYLQVMEYYTILIDKLNNKNISASREVYLN